MNGERPRGRGQADDGSGFALHGPDPLEAVRNAVVTRDPDAFARCFSDEGSVRVPRREGDILIRGRADLARAGRDLRSTIRELTWTPSRRFVSADEVIEEAVVMAHLHERRAGRGDHGPRTPASAPVRVPLRVVASIDQDGRIGGLTLWLDWAALHDPKGNISAGGAASALVAGARSRDERGLRVFENTSEPFIPRPVPAVAPEPEDADRPRPMGRGAIWWQLHRSTVAGTAMALAAVLVLGWIGLTVLRPLVVPQFSSSASDDDPTRGAGLDGPADGATGSADPDGTGRTRKSSGSGTTGSSGSSNSGNDPQTRATAAPVVTSQAPGVKPTVQEGDPVTFLSDVLFPFGSPELSASARAELEQYAAHLQKTGVHGTIQVNGYTDSIGTEKVNLDLSRRRALAVAEALAPHLDGRVVTLRVQAFGESDPVGPHSDDTAAGRRRNRRVVVVIPQ